MKKNTKLLLSLAALAVLMFGVAFAFVPLYDLFCRVTGFGGTTQQAQGMEGVAPVERWITVRFNADIDRKLPWKFYPDQKEVRVRVGEQMLASFTAENLAASDITGTALYNVTPLKAGKYFTKIQCFCFDLQTLNAGQKVSMPVAFFIDPTLIHDNNLDDVTTITLSYTFFKSEDGE